MVQSGELVLPKQQNVLRESYLCSVEGKYLVETLKLFRPHKTRQQVKTIFGFVLSRIKEEFDNRGWDTSILFGLPDPTGIGVTVDLLKLYFYSVCPMFTDDNKIITLSHIECDITIAARFIDNIIAWAASQWHIYISDPDPNWRTHNERNTNCK